MLWDMVDYAQILSEILAMHDTAPGGPDGRYCSHEGGRYEIPCPTVRAILPEMRGEDDPDYVVDDSWTKELDGRR